MAAAAAAAAAWERVSTLSELRASGGRALARLSTGRGVALFLQPAAAAAPSASTAAAAPRVFALDHACYHHGGPLVDGDIEDVPGVGACVLCPWHKYRIALDSGEGFYVGVNVGAGAGAAGGGGGPPREELKSKGLRQRAHACRLAPLPGSAAVAAASAFAGLAEDAEGAADADAPGADMDADAADDAAAASADALRPAFSPGDGTADAAVEVLDMGSVASSREAARLGGRAALRLFREQRRGAGAAAAAAALVLSGSGAGSGAACAAAAPPSAAMLAAVRAQAAAQLAQSDGYARKPFNAVSVSCRGEAGGDDGGGFAAPAPRGVAPSAVPLHSSVRDLRPSPPPGAAAR